MSSEDAAPSWSLIGFDFVRVRADGPRIEFDDLAEYLTRIRVPAMLVDGERVGAPSIIEVQFVIDDDGIVVQDDGIDRPPLTFESFYRSVLHHFDTIAIVGDAIFDAAGGVAPDAPAEKITAHLENLARVPHTPVVHAIASADDMDADFIASAAETPVSKLRLGDFLLVHDPSGDTAENIELAQRRDLPAVSLERCGERRIVRARIRHERSTIDFLVIHDPATVLVGPQPATGAFLEAWDRVKAVSQAPLPADLHAALETAAVGAEPESFFEDILTLLELPTTAAHWAEGVTPDGDIRLVEPKSTMRILRDSMREQMTDDNLESVKFFGAFRRFLRKRPVLTLCWGLVEIALGIAFFTLAADWGLWVPIRWIVGGLWLFDGVLTVSWGVTLLRKRSAPASGV